MNTKKALLLALFAALILSYFLFDLGQCFSLDFIKSQQAAFDTLYQKNPALILGGFFLIYVVVTALSLPGSPKGSQLGAGIIIIGNKGRQDCSENLGPFVAHVVYLN